MRRVVRLVIITVAALALIGCANKPPLEPCVVQHYGTILLINDTETFHRAAYCRIDTLPYPEAGCSPILVEMPPGETKAVNLFPGKYLVGITRKVGIPQFWEFDLSLCGIVKFHKHNM